MSVDPTAHTTEAGERFDARFYRACYADALGDEDAWSHYLRVGQAEGWPTNANAMNRAAIAEGEAFDLIAAALDRAYYVRQFPSLRGTTVNAAQHFLLYGWRRGLEPSPDFSTAFYLERSPDVAAAGVIPFYHYLAWGRHEGRRGGPGPVSLDGPVLNENDLLVGAEFDRTFYLDSHPELEATHVDPLLHFMAFGWRQGFDPTPDFSIAFYLEQCPDVRASGANPFEHYLRYGRREGRAASAAAVGRRRPLSPDERLMASEFDTEFYLTRYPELVAMNVDPLLHFFSFGWLQGKDPNAEFSTRFYLNRAPELVEAEINPFLHWLTVGRARGRMPRSPDPEGVETDFERGASVRALVGAAMDEAFYRAAYPERAVDDPLEDYLGEGWRLGRDPTPHFSTGHYRARYPDAELTGFNPFFHYLAWGREHGLEPFPDREGRSHATFRPGPVISDPQLRAAWAEARGREHAPPAPVDTRKLDIHWVLPDIEAPGRGGHMTILRMVRWLELFGHRCTLWVNDPDMDRSMEARTDLMLRSYQVVQAELRLLPDRPEFPADALVVATSWETAHRVDAAGGGAARFYFVQDHEPAFYPVGARALAAEQTYEFDMRFICAGRWLAERLSARGRWTRSFQLAPEDRSAPAVRTAEGEVARIAFYARQHTERRMFELGVMALEQLHASGLRFEAELFGAERGVDAAAFAVTNHGVVSPEALSALFARCDVGLCLSGTNYSLVPQEMMACGLPVVELDGDNTRSVFPEGVVTLARGEPAAIAEAIQSLLADETRRSAQVERASAWVSPLSWERAARAVEAALIEGVPAAFRTVGVMAPTDVPLASVVIPTLNGGGLFRTVLQRVLSQRAPWPFEVLVVDSESTDGTWEHLLSLGDRVRAWQVPRSEFQHGRTRNQAVEAARGEFVALLTQDAEPADDFWLYDLVESLRRRPRAAGAFGRHLARREASPFTHRDLEAVFNGLAQAPLEMSRFHDPERWSARDPAHRRMIRFFSDNNACLRRSVWRRRPYPEVAFGEDQLWAAQVVAEGYSKVYVPSARVIHSHDYNEAERFERARVEAAFLFEAFGDDVSPADPDDRLRRMNIGDQLWGVRNGVPSEAIASKQRLNAAELRGAVAGVAEARARHEASG